MASFKSVQRLSFKISEMLKQAGVRSTDIQNWLIAEMWLGKVREGETDEETWQRGLKEDKEDWRK